MLQSLLPTTGRVCQEPERAPPALKKKKKKDLADSRWESRQSQRVTLCRGVVSDFLFFGLDSLKKKEIKRKIQGRFSFLSKHDKHYIQSW